mmetsp:Transcript_49093/g.131381  ORF Transcript_49093/g.131381 Transcript_49093/m.131381 type:complete len:217 (+) Transcript_49093:1202-1852(+)
MLAELLQAEISTRLTSRVLEGSLQLILLEEGVLLLAELRELGDEGRKLCLVELAVLTANLLEEALLGHGLGGHVLLQGVHDLLEPEGGQEGVILLVGDERRRDLFQRLQPFLQAVHLLLGLGQQPGGDEAMLLVAQEALLRVQVLLQPVELVQHLREVRQGREVIRAGLDLLLPLHGELARAGKDRLSLRLRRARLLASSLDAVRLLLGLAAPFHK